MNVILVSSHKKCNSFLSIYCAIMRVGGGVNHFIAGQPRGGGRGVWDRLISNRAIYERPLSSENKMLFFTPRHFSASLLAIHLDIDLGQYLSRLRGIIIRVAVKKMLMLDFVILRRKWIILTESLIAKVQIIWQLVWTFTFQYIRLVYVLHADFRPN